METLSPPEGAGKLPIVQPHPSSGSSTVWAGFNTPPPHTQKALWLEFRGAGEHTVKAIFYSCLCCPLGMVGLGGGGRLERSTCRHLDPFHGPQRVAASFYRLHFGRSSRAVAFLTHILSGPLTLRVTSVRPILCRSSGQWASGEEKGSSGILGYHHPYLRREQISP